MVYVFDACFRVRSADAVIVHSHAFEVIGKLRFKVRFDPGLDEDHEKLATDQQKQHSMDTYLAAEGMNAQIEKARSGRGDDDAKTPREKELERRDLHRRGRGVMQVKPMRTLKWMGDGFKSKTRDLKDKIKPGNSAPQRESDSLAPEFAPGRLMLTWVMFAADVETEV